MASEYSAEAIAIPGRWTVLCAQTSAATRTALQILADNFGTNVIVGAFVNPVENGRIVLGGGLSGRISYEGDKPTGSVTGGNDIVLYDLSAEAAAPRGALIGLR